MSFILFLTLIVPLLGAGGVLVLSLLRRVRPYTCYIALVAAVSTAALVLALGWREPVTVIPSLWRPSLLFGATLMLRPSAVMQPLALALALATCSAILVELSRSEEVLPGLVAAPLALLAVGLAALWSANILTMVVSWAIYDLLKAVGHIAAGGSSRKVVQGLFFGGLATLFLWGGALLAEDGASGKLWSLMALSDIQRALWAVAGVLRLWIYPLHFPTPNDVSTVSPLAASLLLGPVVGWGLWIRLASTNGGSIPSVAGTLNLAAVTSGLGSFLAWSSKSPRRSLPWIGMGASGSVLLAAGLTGESAVTVIAAGSAAWGLGVTATFLMPFLDVDPQREAPWWGIPSGVGALTLAGAPLTLGFVTGASLMGELGDHLGWAGAFFAGHLFLVPALVRWLLMSSSSPPPRKEGARIGRSVARGIGLGLPTLPLIVAGLHPPLLIRGVPSLSLGALLARPDLIGWLLWALSLAGGGVIAWQEENLRPKIGQILSAAHDLLCLEWLYEAVVGALERGLSLFRTADEIMGSAGALLWSLLLFLIFLLIWGGR